MGPQATETALLWAEISPDVSRYIPAPEGAPDFPQNPPSYSSGFNTVDQPRLSGPNAPPAPRSKTRNNGYTLDWAYADQCLESLQGCGKSGNMFVHDRCGARVFVQFRCDERPCALCAPRRVRRIRRRYELIIRKFIRPSLLTFTVPNVKAPGELPGSIQGLTQGYQLLRRDEVWPKCKGFWSLEVTWSAEQGYHPHLHVLADFPFLENWERDFRGGIAAAWSRLTGAKHEVDLARPKTPEEREGLFREAIKYVTKQWELDDSALRAILAVIGQRRMFNPFGGLEASDLASVEGKLKRLQRKIADGLAGDKLAAALERVRGLRAKIAELLELEEDDDGGARCPKCMDPLSHAFKNFTRVYVPEEEYRDLKGAPEFQTVYTGWFFKDADPGLDRSAEEVVGGVCPKMSQKT